MKKIFLLLVVFSLFIIPGISHGQGTNCVGAEPLCLNVTNAYPAGVNNGQGEAGPNYGCLGSQPNPVWYYLEILNSGDILLDIVGGVSSSSNDVDFICWGPYASTITPCTAQLTGTCSPCYSDYPNGSYPYPYGNLIDCSYNSSATEQCYIPNGVPGEIYIIMITNYSNTPCNIEITQTGGNGSANCNIPPTDIFEEESMTLCSDSATLEADAVFTEYMWSTGDTTPVITVYNSGMFYITATYADTLLLYDSIDVHLTQPYLSLNLGSDTLICSNTSLLLNAGSGFSNYDWNTGSSDSAITVSQTGIYQVLTTDSALCIYADTIDVVIDPLNSLELGNDTSLCDYSPFNLDAGIGFDNYIWSTGETTQSIYIDSSGTYYVTATNTSCSVTVIDSLQVTFNALPIAEAGINDTICPGDNGTLSASGGISYQWSSGAVIQTMNATPITSTTYFVTVTNSLGCTAIDSASIIVYPAVISNILDTDASCGLDNGTVTVIPSGGIGPYSYQWNTTPPQYTSTITDLSAGTYTVIITDDATGCTSTNTVVISDIQMLSVAVHNLNSANCGMSNGSISAQPSGGTAPFTYLWNSIPVQYSNILTNVPAGVYCVTVTDNNGCSVSSCGSVFSIGYAAPEVCMVSTDTATNHCIVVWEKPVTNGIDQYYIYRESSISGIYNHIGTQDYNDYSIYLDTTSNSIQQPYRYKLAINDTCGTLSEQGTHHQTIHLTVYAGSGGSWNLLWNDYEGFTFSTYNIYRGTNSLNLSLLNSVASTVTSYTDVTPPSGNMYYLIEALRPTLCNPSLKEGESVTSTVSNIANTAGIGFDEFSDSGTIQIFPNPGQGIFTIVFSNQKDKIKSLEVLNSLGQTVYTGILTSTMEKVDLKELSKGIYFIKINSYDSIYFNKIIIE
jgi:hypothetical protein